MRGALVPPSQIEDSDVKRSTGCASYTRGERTHTKEINVKKNKIETERMKSKLMKKKLLFMCLFEKMLMTR